MRTVFLAVALIAACQAATILDIAKSLPEFSTLVAVAGKAGIAPILDAPGVKTAFAPTNTAFGLLGNNTAGWLLNDHNQQALLSALLYHVAPGALTTSTFNPTTGNQVETLDIFHGQASPALVVKKSTGWTINNALFTQDDVIASNGVIQVIDRVLVPNNVVLPSRDIVETAVSVPILSTLVKAVVAAGLAKALSQPNGPYTVFAPTDAAFAAVPAKVLNCLLGNPAALAQVILFHAVSGFIYSEQVPNGAVVTTLANKPLTLNVNGAKISINYGASFPAANVILANVDTSNGVVHVIDRVIFDGTGPCA